MHSEDQAMVKAEETMSQVRVALGPWGYDFRYIYIWCFVKMMGGVSSAFWKHISLCRGQCLDTQGGLG